MGGGRLGAYSRRGAVPTDAEVDDIRAGCEDRYGPRPPEAEELRSVARLRAEAVRLGIRELTIVKGSGWGAPSTARIAPLPLKTSQQIRLKRLHPKAIFKEADQQLVLQIPPKAHPSEHLVQLLRDLIPAEDPVPA